MKKVLHVLLFLCCPLLIMADPACPDSVLVTQTDGTRLWTVVHGDEFYNWRSTTDGNIRNYK